MSLLYGLSLDHTNMTYMYNTVYEQEQVSKGEQSEGTYRSLLYGLSLDHTNSNMTYMNNTVYEQEQVSKGEQSEGILQVTCHFFMDSAWIIPT